MSTRVSVVMCTFNGCTYLPQQLDSFLTQTLQPYELVIFDDASSDGTVSLVEDFKQRAPFPVHIHVQPSNVGSTRNFDDAIESATGDYIALCDQDDVWFPEKLHRLTAALLAHPEMDGVFSDAMLMRDETATSSGRTLWQLHGFDKAKRWRFSAGRCVEQLLRSDIVTGATFMIKPRLRPLWHPIPVSWVHDGWLTWMLAVHGGLMFVNEPLMGYRIHEQQQLGIGHGGRFDVVRRVRQTERLRYARVAGMFQELLARLEQQGVTDSFILNAVRMKIGFLEQRAALPQSLLPRTIAILRLVPFYFRFARGWRSMRKDIFLS